MFFGVSKTTESNELKFSVELESYGNTPKISGHLDKVAITVILVKCTGSCDVHSTAAVTL